MNHLQQRLISLLLACILCFSVIGSAAADAIGEYTSLLFTSDSYSQFVDLYDTSYGRALLTLLAMFEGIMNNAVDGDDLDLTSTSYVGLTDTSNCIDVFIAGATDGQYCNLVFWHDGSFSVYTFYYTAEEVLQNYPTYKINSMSDLSSAAEAINEVLSE